MQSQKEIKNIFCFFFFIITNIFEIEKSEIIIYSLKRHLQKWLSNIEYRTAREMWKRSPAKSSVFQIFYAANSSHNR